VIWVINVMVEGVICGYLASSHQIML
jgi:hypothetical protein